jgi:hypothetical protein
MPEPEHPARRNLESRTMRPLVVTRVSESEVNWIGGICALAVVTIVVALVTDLRMTSCQARSVYSIVGLCRPVR